GLPGPRRGRQDFLLGRERLYEASVSRPQLGRIHHPAERDRLERPPDDDPPRLGRGCAPHRRRRERRDDPEPAVAIHRLCPDPDRGGLGFAPPYPVQLTEPLPTIPGHASPPT